jgi:hypothetical protein
MYVHFSCLFSFKDLGLFESEELSGCLGKYVSLSR